VPKYGGQLDYSSNTQEGTHKVHWCCFLWF